MYLTASIPDLMFSVCLASRYMERPTEVHMGAVKRIMRYVRGTINYGIMYGKQKLTDQVQRKLIGFTDSDYAGDNDDRKSTSRYVFMLNSATVSWSSKKQPVVNLSTTEAEFIVAASCACQSIWLRRILDQFADKQEGATVIYCDNDSTIKLSKNPVLHGRSKHIDIS